MKGKNSRGKKKKKAKPVKTQIRNYCVKMDWLLPSFRFASDSFFVSCFSLLLSSLSEILLVCLPLLLHIIICSFVKKKKKSLTVSVPGKKSGTDNTKKAHDMTRFLLSRRLQCQYTHVLLRQITKIPPPTAANGNNTWKMPRKGGKKCTVLVAKFCSKSDWRGD